MANKQMNFSVGIKTTYDATGVNKLKADLSSLANLSANRSYFGQFADQAPEAIKAANTLKAALSQAYNPKLGTATLDRFNRSILKSDMSLKEIQAGLHQFGVKGDMAFVNATQQLLRMDNVARTTNTTFDKMFTTLKNTITWGMSSALWNNITGSIQKTYYYIKDLDTALNDIRIVTGKSNDEMAEFAKNANEAAKSLGTSTRNYAEGSLIYYQQGLSDEEVKTRTDITAKTAMVTGQSMDQVSEQLTAVWNGYKASAEEAELYVDRLAAVAATTASDLEELSVGMSKVASSAANLGVTESQLSAILATTISVTRQAPESVGTAYKTIFARISDIKAGLDTETTFGNYTSKMAEMGISVLDATGNLRDMGEVIEEIGSKWQTMTREQQISLAQTMAGTRQYNNLVALFDNWGNYVETLNTAENAAGTLAQQHNIALDSINNRLNILKATWEDLYQNLISADDIKDIISALTNFAQVMADIVKSVGGLKSILPGVVGLFLQIGSAKIGQELGNYVNNFIRMGQSAEIAARDLAVFEANLKDSLAIEEGLETSEAQNQTLNSMISYYKEISEYKKVMTKEDEETFNELLKQETELGNIKREIEEISVASKKAAIGDAGLTNSDRDFYKFMNNQTNGFSLGIDIDEKNVGSLNKLSAGVKSLVIDYQQMLSTVNQPIETTGLDELEMCLNSQVDAGTLTELQMQSLIEKFNEFSKKAGSSSEATKPFITFLNRIANESGQAAEGLLKIKVQEEALMQNKVDFKEFLNINALINDATKLAGIFSSLSMSVTSLISLTKVWSDDSVSFGDKVLRTITSVGFLLPSIMKTISSISTYVEEINKLGLKRNTELGTQLYTTTQITKEMEKQSAIQAAQAKLDKAAELRADAKLKEKQLKNDELYNPLRYRPNDDIEKIKWKNSNKGKERLIANQRKQARRLEAEGNGAMKDATQLPGKEAGGAPGLIGLISSAPQAAAVIAGVIVALSALVAGIAAVEEAQKRATKKSLEELKSLKEKIDEREKEVQQLNSLRDSYVGLKSQLDKNEITEIEYRNQVLALTKDIEDQSVKLQLLRGDYEDLGQTMQNIAEQNNKNLILDYGREIDKAKATMQAAFVQGTSFGQDLWKTFTGAGGAANFIPGYGTIGSIGSFVKGVGKDNQVISRSLDPTANSEFKKYVKENDIGHFLKTGGPGGYQLHIEDEDIVEAYEAIDKAIQDNAHLANTETIKELTTIRDNMQEAYDIQKEAQNKMNELKKENLVYEVDESSLTSIENYYDKVNQLAQDALNDNLFDGEDAYSKARVWANSALSGINAETSQWSKKVALEETLLVSANFKVNEEEMENEYKQLEEKLSSLTEAELRLLLPIFFTLGEGTAKSYIDGITNYLEKNEVKEFVEAEEKASQQQKMVSAIGLANESKSFNTKEVQEILKDTDLNTDEFRNLNYGNQMLTAIWTQNEKGLPPEVADKIKESYRGQIDEANKILKEEQDKAFEENKDWFSQKEYNKAVAWTNDLNYYDDNAKIYKNYNEDEIENLAKAYLEAGNSTESFTEEQKNLWDTLVNKKIINEEELKSVYSQSSGYQKVKADIDKLNDAITETNNETQDWLKVRQQAEKVTEDYDKSLDDIQTAYKALSAAEKEWNLNEGFSVDTLQDLLKMNPAYIEALEVEGNQFKVNTDRLNELARAQAVAEVNSAEMAQQALFMDAVQKGVNSTEWEQIFAMETYAGTVADTTSELWKQVDALIEMKTRTGELTDAQADALRNVMSQRQNYYAKARHIAENVDVTKDTKKSGKSSKKDEKNYRDDFDRYWEFLKAIDKVADAIDKLEKKEKNLFGREKISSLKTKNNLLKLQVKTYNDLFEEQKREQSELMGTLGSKGMTFNAEGEITNYAQKTSEALAAYNEAVRKYNAGMLSEEAFKIQEKAYEDFKKEVERYDKLYYSEMKDTLEKIEDIRRQVLANNLEAWEIEIKLKVDWGSLEREWADFLHNIEKDFTAVYEDLGSELGTILEKANTYSGDEGIISVDLKAIQDVMTEIDKLKAGGESDMFESISQAQEKLKELNSSLMKDSTDLKKLWEEAYKAYLQGIDQLNDKLEDQMERYEQIDKELAHQQKLIGLLYGDDAYSMMNTLYKNQEKNQLAEISSLRTQKDLWEDKWKAAEEGSQEQLKYYNLMIEAQNNLNASVEDYVELLQKDLANAVRETVDALDKSVTNGLGIDKVREQWDDLQDYNDGYFDENQRIFEIEKFGLTVEQKMADASAKTQKALKAFQEEELERLKKKEDLNEYDIKAAEYRLQLKEKELALEDAQNAKNSMKVTRDTNGNWTYQYVADEEDVANKQLDLIKATEDYYNFAKETHQKSLEDMMDLQEWYKEAIIEISTDMTLTQEEKEKRMQEATEKYERHAERLMAEANITAQDMAATAAYGIEQSINSSLIAMEDLTARQKEIVEQVCADNITDFQNLYKAVEDNNNNIRTNIEEMLGETVPEWQTAAQDMADAWNADDGASIKAMVTDAIDEILDYLDEYEDKLDELQDTAGMDFDDIVYNINEATDATEDLKDMIEELCNDNDLDDLKDIVDDLADSWDDVKDSIVRAIDKIKEYLRLMGQAQNASVNLNTPNAGGGSPSGDSGGNSGGSPSSTPPGQTGPVAEWFSVKSTPNGKQKYVLIGYGANTVFATLDSAADSSSISEWLRQYGSLPYKNVNGDEGLTAAAAAAGINLQSLAQQYGGNYKSELENRLKNLKISKVLSKYDTGGYTGEWLGGDGKLAMLHSKELVLNADDTANFLSAVSMIREIASFGTSIENSIAAGVNSFMNRFSDSAYGLTRNETTNNTKQNVFNINAPITSTAATDEIQMAILQLPNLASQYVSRNGI